MYHFNSIKVRLERNTVKILNVNICNFNSIKVRLERRRFLFATPPIIFQFHKGTIRTAVKADKSFTRI